MREIKFRAWHKQNKEMLIPREKSEMNSDNYWMIEPEYNHLSFRLVGNCDTGDLEEYELMQFTGLKDKNGKEIYEGDILQLTKPMYTWKLPENGVCIVEWVPATGFYPFSSDLSQANPCEIIGNIHENPELLK